MPILPSARACTPIGEGLDVALVFEKRNGLGGQAVFEGVGVEVDEHEKRVFRIQDSESRMGIFRSLAPDFILTTEF